MSIISFIIFISGTTFRLIYCIYFIIKTLVSNSGNFYACAPSSEVHMCGCNITQNGVEFKNHCCSTQNCNTPSTLTISSSTNCQCGVTNSTTCSAKSGSPLTTRSSWEIIHFLAISLFFFIKL
jgi:hypothetical protein